MKINNLSGCNGEREYLTIDEVQRFMAVETEGKETQRAFAFACFTGLRISDIRKWIAEHAGIKKNVSFHTSRHTFATLTLSVCNDLKLVSELLGHKSVKTTQRYAEVMLANKSEVVNRVGTVFTS